MGLGPEIFNRPENDPAQLEEIVKKLSQRHL